MNQDEEAIRARLGSWVVVPDANLLAVGA